MNIKKLTLTGLASLTAAMGVMAPMAAAKDQVVDTGWSRGLHLPFDTDGVPDKKCPPATPYLIDHDYAPFGTSVAPGVEIQEDTSPWAINVYAPEYSATPVDPADNRPLIDKGYLTGIKSWSLDSDAGTIVNTATHYGLKVGDASRPLTPSRTRVSSSATTTRVGAA